MGSAATSTTPRIKLNLGPNANRGLTSSANNQNNLFSPSELERLLRPYDRDAPSLPARLPTLMPGSAGSVTTQILKGRLDVTTESWDWPGQVGVKRIAKLLTDRGIPQSLWGQLLPPELLAGLKMNINRPFGNGRDDLNSGVVDSAAEGANQSVMLSGSANEPDEF